MTARVTKSSSGSVVTPLFGGLLHSELEAREGTKVTDWYVRGPRRVSLGEEEPGSRRELMLCLVSGRSFLEKGEVYQSVYEELEELI